MLDKNKMQLETRELCETVELFNMGNGQSIRERLLRQAVKSCDMYATDIVIVINKVIPRMYTENLSELDLYFVQSGVNWVSEEANDWSKEVPSHYRYTMKLVKNKSTLLLYSRIGNV